MIRRMSRISAMLVGRIARQEDSPSGLWRTLGKRVGCKPSGVRIPHPPQASGDGLPRRTESRHFPLSHNEKSPCSRDPKIPPSIAVHRRISPRRGTFGGTISKREGVFFARRYCTVSLMQFLAVSRTPFLGICRLHLPDAAKALSMRGITPFEQRDVGLSKVNGLGHATTHY